MMLVTGWERIRWAPFFVAYAIYALASGALSWDGSYYLFRTLHEQAPVVFHQRVAAALLLMPTWAIQHVTSDLSILRFVFGLTFAVAGAGALAAAIRMSRGSARQQSLVAIGFGIVTAPVQFFGVCETLLVTQLTWPLALLLCRPPTRMRIAFVVLVAIILMALHPLAFIPLGVLAIASHRRWGHDGRVYTSILLAGALVRVAIPRTQYDKDMSTFDNLWPQFQGSLSHAPILGLIGGSAVALLLVRYPSRRRPMLVITAVSATAVALWAVLGTTWNQALDYRSVSLFASTPLWLAAMHSTNRAHAEAYDYAQVEKTERNSELSEKTGRTIITTVGVAFAIMLIVQSWQWHGAINDFEQRIASAQQPCFARTDLRRDGPVSPFWTSSALSLVLQTREPETVALTAEQCQMINAGLPVNEGLGGYPVRPGWFSLDISARWSYATSLTASAGS